MPFNPHDPEFRQSAKLGSVYANRAYVTVQGGMARIVFGEAAANQAETVFHTAVTLTPADLLGLADVIQKLIDEAYPPDPAHRRLGESAAQTYGDIPRKPTGG